MTGYVHNVVFTCGAVPEPDGTVKIYWGAADTVMCVGEADIASLVDLCLDDGRPAESWRVSAVVRMAPMTSDMGTIQRKSWPASHETR